VRGHGNLHTLRRVITQCLLRGRRQPENERRSRNTISNVRFEMDRAWAALRPGGAIVVDDIDVNRGFHAFAQSFSGCEAIVCEAEPLRPDPRRFNKKGLFGIVLKESVVRTAH
jgi:hypothetical protein